MKTRLRACDRWHPHTPAIIYTAIRKNGSDVPYEIHLCRRCQAMRTKFRDCDVTPPPLRESGIANAPYGVLPRLNWTPPPL